MIEKVKKILMENTYNYKLKDEPNIKAQMLRATLNVNNAAQQICQKFPKSPDNPDGYEPRADIDRGMGKIISKKSKPDRLLTEWEILDAMNKNPFDCLRHIKITEGYYLELKEIAKAQDTKTASIKDAECQERLEGILREIEEHATESIAVKDSDTGQQMEIRAIPSDWWQALKKKEGVK